MNISYSFGIIDLFHYGHLCALKRASENSDLHVFGLVSEKAATAWQGNIVSSETERKAVLESVRYVDRVMLQDDFDPTDNIRRLHAEFPEAKITLYHGSDMAVIPAEGFLRSIGGNVEILDYYERLSPLRILQGLSEDRSGHLPDVNIISTKANTLIALKSRLKKSMIEDIYVCTVDEFENSYDEVFEKICRMFEGRKVVVRSSSKGEDSYESSNAGHYESILGVEPSDREALKETLQAVIHSYQKDGKVNPEEQILIQSQTMDVRCSGVVFTRDIQNNRPYYVVNYDDHGGTDTVTSGAGGKTLWIARDTEDAEIPGEWKGLLNSVKEIENVLNGALLDIEFAVKTDGTVVIFQTRPLAANYKYNRNKRSETVLSIKNNAVNRYLQFRSEKRYLLSDMAFWNPAEIIGDSPHPLDYSLYREAITHRAWNEGLVKMGYREIREDLMYKLGNKPYICVDYAFESLIPAELDGELAEKLTDYYRWKLSQDYSAHDKIEFEVVISCYDFETSDKLEELRRAGFSSEEVFELKRALYDLTYGCIRNYSTVLGEDLADLETLEKVRLEAEAFLKEQGNDTATCVQQIQRLLQALEEHGTPQFSRHARCAFIAKSLCGSMVRKGYISSEEHDSFMCSISTVAKQFECDYGKMAAGKESVEEFNKKYGHLRAGSYDIRTPRYDAMEMTADIPEGDYSKPSRGSGLPKKKVETALKGIGMSLKPEELECFIRKSIEQREYFKFIFTRSLSRVIEIIAKIGERLGFDREEMSFLEIPQILALQFYDDPETMADSIRAIIALSKDKYKENGDLILPEVVTGVTDMDVIHMEESRPNFITENSVTGKVVVLDGSLDADITGKIVAVEKADPGFDWIFSRGIAGLVTKYGGVASHMAIRCAEFGIPAAIGCGSKIYGYVKGHAEITIDCRNKKITGGPV